MREISGDDMLTDATHFATSSRFQLSMAENLLPSSANEARWAETWQELGQGAPTLAAVMSGGAEDIGGGGGWSWVLSDLKSLLETGERMANL